MPDPSADDLSRLLNLLYSAAEHPDQWPQFLLALRDAAGADGANLVLQDFVDGQAQTISTPRDPDAVRQYGEYYGSINPWMPPHGRRREPPPALQQQGEAAISTAAVRKTEFYADWGRRNDVVFTWGLNLNLQADRYLFMSVDRGERRGTFDARLGRLLELIAPHARRAFRMHTLRERTGVLDTALDRTLATIVFLGRRGEVVEMTAPARALIDRGDGLRIQKNQVLRAQSPVSQRALAEALAALARDPRAARAIRIARRAGLRDHFAAVSCVGGPLDGVPGARACYMLTILKPGTSNRIMLAAAGAAYGLTPAETRLVHVLLETTDLEQARAQLGVSRNTVRTQLSSIFAKTGTRRQLDLLLLFASYGRFSLPEV